ncbi:MAG TPA: carboxypeptidase regulatory-like domain-containing protein [Vicinamibacterales bacterium]|jgi:plastocyanin
MRYLWVVLALGVAMPAGRAAGPTGSSSVPSGILRGRVTVARPLSAVRSMPAPGSGTDGRQRGLTGDTRRQAVVFFEEAPAGDEAPTPTRVRMHQTSETFVPHLLAITTGSTVEFPNDDRTYHNVFSLSKARRFDLGRYAAGQSKSVTFDRAGFVRVFCEIHSHMNAFILVFGHRFFAVTDQDGRYRIDRIPPGTYRVTAWYEGIAERTEQVTILAGGTADLDFTLR